jgi:hypothetical protein
MPHKLSYFLETRKYEVYERFEISHLEVDIFLFIQM